MVMNINDTTFDSFFQERIIDNNGVSVTDINAGLKNLYVNFNEYADKFYDSERIYISENMEGYPDLVAKQSILNDQRLWWWVLIFNSLENPMTDLKANWIYSIANYSQISNFINQTNENGSSNNNERIGKVVELN